MDIKSLFLEKGNAKVEQPYVRDPHMKRIPLPKVIALLGVCIAITLVLARNINADNARQILNVSYGPTHELCGHLNEELVALERKQSGGQLDILQSHGSACR